ncbi:putative thioredoxin [Gregarina niphandrodes]|uniref:Thioredoxin n=1 Tax=Gregarina niphandrodes TaxID=110365 RepID=A0A023B960_GRENI|nr:putative thioredoxin [Gregarina niphandrodes]EZG71252.1 putative thioredoxin [Gregarina niphandrodes]|eukprot:XP_011129835.1 putative thioredoxin [Gregarina niphandrodes]
MRRVMELNLHTLQRALKHEDYVLLEIYAPWCPHCIAFASEYEKVASLLPDLLVARMDGTHNPAPSNIKLQYFPTFAILSNKFDRPVLFTGSRSTHSLVKFVQDTIRLHDAGLDEN